jgi:hypothetical protein
MAILQVDYTTPKEGMWVRQLGGNWVKGRESKRKMGARGKITTITPAAEAASKAWENSVV